MVAIPDIRWFARCTKIQSTPDAGIPMSAGMAASLFPSQRSMQKMFRSQSTSLRGNHVSVLTCCTSTRYKVFCQMYKDPKYSGCRDPDVCRDGSFPISFPTVDAKDVPEPV